LYSSQLDLVWPTDWGVKGIQIWTWGITRTKHLRARINLGKEAFDNGSINVVTIKDLPYKEIQINWSDNGWVLMKQYLGVKIIFACYAS
jgi:hypothetical protein